MFKKNSMLYSVNTIAKLLGLILFFIALIQMQASWFLLLFSLGTVWLCLSFAHLKYWTILGFVCFFFGILFPWMIGLGKWIQFTTYLILLVKITHIDGIRYFLEKSFYKKQNSALTRYLLDFTYYLKFVRENFTEYIALKDRYGFPLDARFLWWGWKLSWKRAKGQLRGGSELYQIRFYNILKERTYVEKPSWENWDSVYVLLHGLFLGLVLWIGG